MKEPSEIAALEIDMAVAQEEMGWRYGGEGKGWIGEGDRVQVIALPQFSESWNAAKLVVEKVLNHSRKMLFASAYAGPKLADYTENKTPWKAEIWEVDIRGFYRECGASLPEAICRAAINWVRRSKCLLLMLVPAAMLGAIL